MKKKLILLSLDAIGNSEFEHFAGEPGFARLIERGAWCRRNRSVYPSLTFPSHSSIITGCTPDHHGVVNNYLLEPGRTPGRWYHYASALKRRALWDYAADGGKKVLSLSWPVSGGANIRYNLPEMNPAKPKLWNPSSFAAQMKLLFTHGTPGLAAGSLMLNPGLAKAWFFGSQPELDNGMMKLLEKDLDRYPYDIALLHIYGMDDAKHEYGADSPQALGYTKAYGELVNRLADYVDCRAAKGEAVTLMVTGDHSQKNVSKSVYGNMLLADMGYCRWGEDGRLRSWQVWMDSCDGMAYLYIHKSVTDGAQRAAIADAVAQRFAGHLGVAAVLRPEKFVLLGCDSRAALVFEGAEGYGFDGGYLAKAEEQDFTGPSRYKAIHGYLPDTPGYETLFFSYGPAVNPGEIPLMRVTDITPTICHWMELKTDEMDGAVIKGLLR